MPKSQRSCIKTSINVRGAAGMTIPNESVDEKEKEKEKEKEIV